MKRIWAFFLTVCMLFSTVIGFSFAEEDDGVVVLNILHTNDMHGSGIADASETKSYYVKGGFSHLIHMTAAHLW